MFSANRPIKLGLLAGAAMGVALGSAAAAEAWGAEPWDAKPWGEWLVKDRTARIRVIDCAGALWGIVAWEADPGVDSKNPDPKLRTRPTAGMPILLGMKPAGPGRWDGGIYNSENGKFYSGGVSMVNENVLRVRGCILGFLCGGENWSRFADASASEPDSAVCARLAGPR